MKNDQRLMLCVCYLHHDFQNIWPVYKQQAKSETQTIKKKTYDCLRKKTLISTGTNIIVTKAPSQRYFDVESTKKMTT